MWELIRINKTKLNEKLQKMQKLLEGPDRKRGNAFTKEGTLSVKEKNLCSPFSSDQKSDNI